MTEDQDSSEENNDKKESSNSILQLNKGITAPPYSKENPIPKSKKLFGSESKILKSIPSPIQPHSAGFSAPEYQQKKSLQNQKPTNTINNIGHVIQTKAGRKSEEKATKINKNCEENKLTDFDYLATILFNTLNISTTDDQCVYHALALLENNAEKIRRIKDHYYEKYKLTLENHISSAFSKSWIFKNDAHKAFMYLQATQEIQSNYSDKMIINEKQLHHLAYIIKDSAGKKSAMFAALALLRKTPTYIIQIKELLKHNYEIDLIDFIQSKFDSENQQLLLQLIQI